MRILTQTSQLSRFHRVSHGFTAFLKVSRWLLHFSRFYKFWADFFQTHSFLKKQTKAVHSNADEERISSLINKNKTSSRSSLFLSWALLFIVLVKTHIDNPFQWKPLSDLLKTVKNPQLNIIDNILVTKYWGIMADFHAVDFCPWRFFCWSFNTKAVNCDNIQTTMRKHSGQSVILSFLKSHTLLMVAFLGISLSLFRVVSGCSFVVMMIFIICIDLFQ